MRRSLLTASALAGALLFSSFAFAADHADSPSVSADPATDITDVYAWMNDDGTHLNLIMDVFPFADATAQFSDTAKYVFNVQSGTAFGDTPTTTQVIATFDGDGNVQVWVGDTDYVSGDASVAGGIGDADLKVFTGLRNDPFFFNLEGFSDATAFVAANAGGITFDANGCPQLDQATAGAILQRLTMTNDGADPAADTLAGANVLSIVIQVNKDSVNSGGDFLAVHGTTNQ